MSTAYLPRDQREAASRPAAVAVFLDVVERMIVVALYAWLVWRIATRVGTEGGVGNLLLLASEGLVLFFFLIRRRTDTVSRSPVEWMLALGATCIPLLVSPGGSAILPLLAAFFLLMGMFVQLHAKVTLGRSFGMVPANRGIKVYGPYRFVRHPMYLGYLISHFGFLLMNPTPWNFGVYVAAYSLQIPRLLAEERMLDHDPAYRQYRSQVRCRLVPGVF